MTLIMSEDATARFTLTMPRKLQEQLRQSAQDANQPLLEHMLALLAEAVSFTPAKTAPPVPKAAITPPRYCPPRTQYVVVDSARWPPVPNHYKRAPVIHRNPNNY